MASSVTHTAVSPANSLDMEPSPATKSLPLRPIHEARHTRRRDASIRIFMSASLKAMDWFSMMARPKALRSLA